MLRVAVEVTRDVAGVEAGPGVARAPDRRPDDPAQHVEVVAAVFGHASAPHALLVPTTEAVDAQRAADARDLSQNIGCHSAESIQRP